MKMPYGEEQIKKNGDKEARKDKLIRIGDIVQCVMFLCSRLSGRC
jgi:ribosome-associated protein YbcJ (S4-like RNA binding protein)